MRWAPALIDRIRALHVAGVVTVRWCTTWCAYADRVERLIGLPPLERCWTEPISHDAAPAAKLAAARAVLAGGRPLIWTDDDALPAVGPPRDELVTGGRALLIAPAPSRGLQPEDMAAIEEFARSSVRPADGDDPVSVARRLLGGG